MDAESRRIRFELMLKAAMEETGYTVSADLITERLGPVLQSRAVVIIVPDPRWNLDKKTENDI
jgi:hypothetical protein